MKLEAPPEILDMKAENGRKVYLTALPPPKLSSRGRRRKSTAKNEANTKANATPKELEAKWWATAEELIERVGTESAEAMISKLINFANGHCAPGVESEESDEEASVSQSNWNYNVWKAEQPSSQLQHNAQHRVQTRRVQQLQSAQQPGSTATALSYDDDDSDDVPVSTLAAGLLPSASSSSSPDTDIITPVVRHKRRVWTNEELNMLANLVQTCGEGNWDDKAVALGTGRTAKSLEMKYYSLQKDRPHRDHHDGAEVESANNTQNKCDAEVASPTEASSASAVSLVEESWRSADDDAERSVVVATKDSECEALQIPAHASSAVAERDVDPATELEVGNTGSKQINQSVQKEEKKSSQEHKQPMGGVANDKHQPQIPQRCTEEIDTERGPAQIGVGKSDDDEEGKGDEEKHKIEGDQEIMEEQEHREDGAKPQEPTSCNPSRPVAAIGGSTGQTRRVSQVIGTGTAGSSALSEPVSPPLSRIGVQSLLSDSDSPEVLDGSPSPLVNTETSVDSDKPAVHFQQLPAGTSDSVQPSLEMVRPGSPSCARAVACTTQHHGCIENGLHDQQEASTMLANGEEDRIEAVAAATAAPKPSVVDNSGREVVTNSETEADNTTKVRMCLQCTCGAACYCPLSNAWLMPHHVS